jgi:hypothetical protein
MQECVHQIGMGNFIRQGEHPLEKILQLPLTPDGNSANVCTANIDSLGKGWDGPTRETIAKFPMEFLEFLESSKV